MDRKFWESIIEEKYSKTEIAKDIMSMVSVAIIVFLACVTIFGLFAYFA